MDFILNGQAQGGVASTLLQHGFNPSALRPWVGKDGRSYVSNRQGEKLIAQPTNNAAATLRKEEWLHLDTAVIAAAQNRLRIVADLRRQGLVYNLPNGMGTTVLQTESSSDITGAMISMDPAREGENDRPEFDLVNLPLPVIHKDFFFNARQIATSRNGGQPLDVTMAQLAARKVSEEAEKLVLGTTGTYSYGGGSIYGLTNFPNRITKVLTSPTHSGWTPNTLLNEILAMRKAAIDVNRFGPFILYTSMDFDNYLDEDYSPLKGDITLRDRILRLNGISEIRSIDGLSGFQVILVEMTSDVIREVIGMDITTVQWETLGGMRVHFKVMAILVPQLRADFYGNSGIVHGVGV